MAACASSSAMDEVLKFGIPETRMFEFWDWVGGRYSVCSSVGALPLSLKYGFGMFERFLAGARAVDIHYQVCTCVQILTFVVLCVALCTGVCSALNALCSLDLFSMH
jgi:glucose-6-phosphate isomerase